MTMQSFILPANGKATPKSIERKRKMAEAMLQSGTDTSPVGHWTQGAARVAQALVGGLSQRKADQQEAEGQQSARDAMTKALMGGSNADMLDAVNNPWMDNASLQLVTDAYNRQFDKPKRNLMEVNKRLYDVDTGEWLTPPPLPPGQGGDIEYGLNPIVTQNPQTGEWQLLQPAKDGSAPRVMPLPDGFEYAPPNRAYDLGTGFGVGPTRGGGGPAGPVIPKDLAGAEAEKARGKGLGDAEVSLQSIQSKMPGLEKVVSDLDALAEKATYTLSGQLWNAGRKELGMEPTEGAVARTEYQVTVANQILPLLRDTFGAQFTAEEGKRLLATLGDLDTTPKEKQATLKAFIEQKRRDIEALALQTGQPVQPVPQQQPAPTPQKRLRYNPNTGELE